MSNHHRRDMLQTVAALVPSRGGIHTSIYYYLDRMGVRVSILVVSSLQILACQGQESVQAHGLCLMESRAIAAASDHLTKQSLSGQYVAGRAYAKNSGDKWSIRIPRAAPPEKGVLVLPAEGLVEVNKADCACRWVPQR